MFVASQSEITKKKSQLFLHVFIYLCGYFSVDFFYAICLEHKHNHVTLSDPDKTLNMKLLYLVSAILFCSRTDFIFDELLEIDNLNWF